MFKFVCIDIPQIALYMFVSHVGEQVHVVVYLLAVSILFLSEFEIHYRHFVIENHDTVRASGLELAFFVGIDNGTFIVQLRRAVVP